MVTTSSICWMTQDCDERSIVANQQLRVFGKVNHSFDGLLGDHLRKVGYYPLNQSLDFGGFNLKIFGRFLSGFQGFSGVFRDFPKFAKQAIENELSISKFPLYNPQSRWYNWGDLSDFLSFRLPPASWTGPVERGSRSSTQERRPRRRLAVHWGWPGRARLPQPGGEKQRARQGDLRTLPVNEN